MLNIIIMMVVKFHSCLDVQTEMYIDGRGLVHLLSCTETVLVCVAGVACCFNVWLNGCVCTQPVHGCVCVCVLGGVQYVRVLRACPVSVVCGCERVLTLEASLYFQ